MGRSPILIIIIYHITTIIQNSYQLCPEEVTNKGVTVVWPASTSNEYITSEPPCYYGNHSLAMRSCDGDNWSPPLSYLPVCEKTGNVDQQDISCPPGFHSISKNNTQYCYQVSESAQWDFPCYRSGGASIITDLGTEELKKLLVSLNETQTSKYFWLPAQRSKQFNPVYWSIPGPNWGKLVNKTNAIPITTSLFKRCLALDLENSVLITDYCSNSHPSLCFYINYNNYPANCPKEYQSFQVIPNEGTCYGIEFSDTDQGMTFDEFVSNKCASPLGESETESTQFVYRKLAQSYKLSPNDWCWYKTYEYSHLTDTNTTNIQLENFTNPQYFVSHKLIKIINKYGTLSLRSAELPLNCMACEMNMNYPDADVTIEFDSTTRKILLTIYYPSGLWKYNEEDIGIQCFSNAKGFTKTVQINKMPYIDTEEELSNSSIIEKVVYFIDLIADRTGQYWCEGHRSNFTFLSTAKLLVSPYDKTEYVFALYLKKKQLSWKSDNLLELAMNTSDLENIFNTTNILLMDILEVQDDYTFLLYHLHVTASNNDEEEAEKLTQIFNFLNNTASTELSKYNYEFVNISSSTYCLPTETDDKYILEWQLTPVNSIVAPTQFCLQDNGLPVMRQCLGSYLTGSLWGPVEGYCNFTFQASNTTTFLYNIINGKGTQIYTTSFLTTGLNLVLDHSEEFIPADIYYLSRSLQHVSNKAQENTTEVELGDLDNIAWAIERLNNLDRNYLKLAQTLNSTNVILDSVNNVIKLLAVQNDNGTAKVKSVNHAPYYQLATKPHFLSQISYPKYTNISGMALVKNNESDLFTDMVLHPLTPNITLDYILSLKNLEVATWIPENVLNTLRQNTCSNTSSFNETSEQYQDVHIVINIFYDDTIFQELKETNNSVSSRVVEISIPGYLSNLEHGVYLIFREPPYTCKRFRKFCGHWNFHSKDQSKVPGKWEKEGCVFIKTENKISVYKCYHLTHFAQLINIRGVFNGNDKNKLSKTHSKVLNVITLIGSFLSLMGVLGIWITAIVFYSWRQKVGTKVLLQLASAVALPLIFIIIFNLDDSIFTSHKDQYQVAEHMEGVCIGLGAALHYSILAGFMWMLITAVLQFVRYVRVLGVNRPSRFLMKLSLIGWGLPLFPVIITLILNKNNYIPTPVQIDEYKRPICYPTDMYFLLAVLLPICCTLVTNVVLFLLVLHSISRGPDGKMRTADIDLIKAQLRLSLFLFFLLGLTWIFGIFSFSKNLIWSYLFCLSSTLQGFVLFIYFVVCDPATRNMWIALMWPNSRNNSLNSVISLGNN